MDKDKLAENKGTTESIEEHYAKIYSDLPDEVVKMLINTHPLYGKDKELTKDMSDQASLKSETAPLKVRDKKDKEVEQQQYEDEYDEDDQQDEDEYDEQDEQYEDEDYDEDEEYDDDEDEDDDIEDEEKEFLSSLFSKQDKKHSKFALRKYLAAAVVLTLMLAMGIFTFSKNAKNNNKISQLQSDNFLLEKKLDSLETEKQQLLENYSDLANELESLKQSSEPTSNQTPAKNNTPSETTIKETTKVTASTTQAPKTYTVVAGDSLWKISKKVYGSGNYYLDIMKANNIKKEGDIFEGMTLKLPDIKGGN